MALLEVRWRPSAKELRWFALGLVLLLGALGVLQATRADSWLAGRVPQAAALVALVGVWRPELIRPVYLLWMAAAYPIGWTISHVLLMGVYYLVVTPIGLAMRAVGRDPMQRQLERSRPSYWVRRDPEQRKSRYLQQF